MKVSGCWPLGPCDEQQLLLGGEGLGDVLRNSKVSPLRGAAAGASEDKLAKSLVQRNEPPRPHHRQASSAVASTSTNSARDFDPVGARTTCTSRAGISCEPSSRTYTRVVAQHAPHQVHRNLGVCVDECLGHGLREWGGPDDGL